MFELAQAPMPPWWLMATAVAAVWFYEGLWNKLLGGQPHQIGIVDRVPLVGRIARWFLPALGVLECLIGIWILSGWQPYACALFQTALLIGMNTGGLLYARHLIHDPGGMVVKNSAFLVLAWVVAANAGAG